MTNNSKLTLKEFILAIEEDTKKVADESNKGYNLDLDVEIGISEVGKIGKKPVLYVVRNKAEKPIGKVKLKGNIKKGVQMIVSWEKPKQK